MGAVIASDVTPLAWPRPAGDLPDPKPLDGALAAPGSRRCGKTPFGRFPAEWEDPRDLGRRGGFALANLVDFERLADPAQRQR